MTVTFDPSADLEYIENQAINLLISWSTELSPAELEEPMLNSIVSKTITISPSSTNITIVENTNNFNITGSFSLDDFAVNIQYVDKGQSDNTQIPTISNKYSLVPNNKDIFRITPIETSKTFVVTVDLKDKNNVSYIKTYNINIKLINTSISNWTQTYFQERY